METRDANWRRREQINNAQERVKRLEEKVGDLAKSLTHPDPELIAKTRKRTSLQIEEAQAKIEEFAKTIAEKTPELAKLSGFRKTVLEEDLKHTRERQSFFEDKKKLLAEELKKDDATIIAEHERHTQSTLEEAQKRLQQARAEHEALERS